MKICLIGPSYPFRGGIAHYTTLLFRALRHRHDVCFYAFWRQYPRWLFPGRTDRDLSERIIEEPGTERLLDAYNPWTWRVVAQRVVADDPDLVIIPWWVSFWTPQFWTIARTVKARTRARLLFLCHNVVQHESGWLDTLATRLVLRNGDHFIVHSEEERQALLALLPSADVQRVYHPTYAVFGADSPSKTEARQRLGVNGPMLLFFGFVRPYKGLGCLIEALPAVTREIDAQLWVVGEFWRDRAEYEALAERLGVAGRVRIVDEYVPNEDVAFYFAAADVVVLPYLSSTGSGVAQIAFGLRRPLIVSDVSCLTEMVDDEETGFVVPTGDSGALARAIIRFYREGWEERMVAAIDDQRDRFSWERMVECIESFGAGERV